MVGVDRFERTQPKGNRFTVYCDSPTSPHSYYFLLKFKPKHVPKNAPRQAGKINI